MTTLKESDLTTELKSADKMLRNNLETFMNKLTKIAQNMTDLLLIEAEKTKARIYCEVITFLTNAACSRDAIPQLNRHYENRKRTSAERRRKPLKFGGEWWFTLHFSFPHVKPR